jgi:two-component system phosphate regulon sensor histidine kinase PhoR
MRCTARTDAAAAYAARVSPEAALIVAVAALVAVLLAIDIRRRRPPATAGPEAVDERSSDLTLVGAVVPVALVLIGPDGRIGFANGAARSIHPGLEAGAAMRGISESLADIVEAARTQGDAVLREMVILGDPPRSLRVSAVAWGDGALVAIVDATEDIDFEEARRTFSAAVSHELRTPLARILGLAETLALPDIDEDRAELAVQIENEVEGMRRLIDEMLLLAALDRGRLAVADGVADLAGVVRGVVDDARSRRLGRGRVIRVRVPDAVEVPVAVRLCEVVAQNLVDNALIHGGQGAAVDVSLAAEGGMAVLVVRDDGIGIPAQHLPYVFQRFYRGDASRTGPGSGLGLALVKHIVEAHGGDVVAESDGRSGTTLRARLPLAG